MTEKKYDLTSFTRRWTALHPMPPLQHAIYNVKKMGYRPILALLKTGTELDAVAPSWTQSMRRAPRPCMRLLRAESRRFTRCWCRPAPTRI